MDHDSFTLVFATAQWCDPGTAMLPIFEETLRDFARLYPKLEVEGTVIDIDDEEADQMAGLPASVDPAILASIDFVPTLILMRGSALEGTEMLRLVGQLPKLVIRAQLAKALGVA
ncbi:MAG: thioredoxin family protein [Ancrocorticia sp.]|nr:thioredoxin family protein [Ancrocorticia sp.]